MSRASMYPILRDSNSSTNSLEADVSWRLSNYFVTQLFFGTSSHLFAPYVILDTADDKIWVQTYGCDPCFEVKGGNPNVQLSASFKLMSLDDPRCALPKFEYNGLCGYRSMYGSRSGPTTMGPMGTDTFLFIDSQTQKPTFFEDIAFGCGVENKNIRFGGNTGPENTISGICGLGPISPKSLINQLDAQVKGRFSYCLTSWAEPNLGRSTMYFGDDARIVGPTVQQIAMNTKIKYHLYFTGISVDGKRLPIDKSVCAIGDTRTVTTGFFIDSGAPSTALAKSAYQPLRLALVSYFAQYGWQPVKEQEYDLCYLSTPKEGQSYPTVVFHFSKGDQGGEVDWIMDKDNMFVRFGTVDGFCMVIGETPDPGPCIFGAYQHANFRVLYDVKKWSTLFHP
ncbi:aspartic proteinase nepenthesin-1-like [Chenopodium quinoa]|uniref:Peptidase A1 domain-containing protein n=1 Tax=Chenopodium quinoa TaxID=63459 RepID=A0A803LSU3_CHEQI|nr:aspartic proteinase nepenthesin-1-like [Chenopodium quinoa]